MSMLVDGSATLMVAEEVRRLRDRGRDIIHLAGGTPAFDLPRTVKEELKSLIANGPMRATDSRGLPALREALAEELRLDKGVSADPAEIVVTVGGKEAVMASLLSLITPGDEILLPNPTWVTYEPWIRRAGGVPVAFSMGRSNNFRPDWNEVESLLSNRTRLVLLTSPHNPTGTVLHLEDLHYLAQILVEQPVLVLSDESNSKIIYDDVRHMSPAQIPALAGRTILVGSFSKNYSMGGWRLGYVWAPHPFINSILAVHQHTVSCVPFIAQKAGLGILLNPERGALVDNMVRKYHSQRSLLIEGLKGIPGVKCHYPEGAYNAFPDFSFLEIPSTDLAYQLLMQQGVSSVPGEAFGTHGSGHLRMAFTLPPEKLREAINRIRRFCTSLSRDNSSHFESN